MKVFKGASITCTVALLLILVGAITASAQNKYKNMEIGTNFWFTGEGSQPRTDDGKAWKPQFLDEIKMYTTLRFMDWQSVNNCEIVINWSNRLTKHNISYEMMVELCNRNNSDAWFCVHALATDNFVTELAKLLKKDLKPSLKVYIEYSNETWNENFDQYGQADSLGRKAKLSGTDPNISYTVYRSLQIFDLFKSVYGSEMDNRVRKVIAGSSENAVRTIKIFRALKDTVINPKKILIDNYAIAPYFGGVKLDGSDLVAAMKLANDAFYSVAGHWSEVNAYNVEKHAKARLIGYEGGQHFKLNAHLFSANSKAYDVYIAYLNSIAPYLDLFCHYAHVGSWTSGNSWGSKQFIGQDIKDAHKYRALVDWQKANPYDSTKVYVPSTSIGSLNKPHSASLLNSIELQSTQSFDLNGRIIGNKSTNNSTKMVIIQSKQPGVKRTNLNIVK